MRYFVVLFMGLAISFSAFSQPVVWTEGQGLHYDGEKKEDNKEAKTSASNEEVKELLVAVMNGDTEEVIRQIKEEGKDVNISLDDVGNKAIHLAALDGNIDMIKALLSTGANIDARDGLGFTALMVAIEDHQLLAAETLINEGADVNAESFDRTKVLMLAVVEPNLLSITQLLIDKGAAVNASGPKGSVLNYAIYGNGVFGGNNLAAVKLLVSKGAIVDESGAATVVKPVSKVASRSLALSYKGADSSSDVLGLISKYLGYSVSDVDQGLREVIIRLFASSSDIDFDSSLPEFLFGKGSKQGVYRYVSKNADTDIRKAFLFLLGTLVSNQKMGYEINVGDARLITSTFISLGYISNSGVTAVNSTKLAEDIFNKVKGSISTELQNSLHTTLYKNIETVVKF